jgi:hypothetical protein
MAHQAKKFKAALAKVDRVKRYKLDDAMKLVKETATKKFDETVDAAINLGVDPKHADQVVRGAVVLPHGMGKAVKIAVFAKGDKAKEAEGAGADIVGAETVASLALCVGAVIAAAGKTPVGVNVLRNDARAALGICAATGAKFVRVNVHSGVAATDQGWIEGRAHSLVH